MANTREVDIHELKALDPRRFEKEHQYFIDNCLHPEWWDCIEAQFKGDMAEIGVAVDSIQFGALDSGYSDATWTGSFNLAPFMKRMGLDERYPALYLAVEYDRAWAKVYTDGWRSKTLSIDIQENTRFIEPLGIFSELDEETWEELLDDQWSDCGLGEVAREFAQDKADDLYKALRAEWDYLTSEEYFIESCENNEVKFEIEEGETV